MGRWRYRGSNTDEADRQHGDGYSCGESGGGDGHGGENRTGPGGRGWSLLTRRSIMSHHHTQKSRYEVTVVSPLPVRPGGGWIRLDQEDVAEVFSLGALSCPTITHKSQGMKLLLLVPYRWDQGGIGLDQEGGGSDWIKRMWGKSSLSGLCYVPPSHTKVKVWSHCY